MLPSRPDLPSPRTDVQIRRMCPADVDRVVALHIEAFPGFFLTQLGGRFLHAFYARFPQVPSAIALVAVGRTDEELLGFAAGATDPRGFYSRLLRRHWMRFALAALPRVIRQPATAPRVARAVRHPGANPPGAGVAGLFSIAVRPASQGRAVGSALLTSFLDAAHAGGSRAVVLTTDAEGNEATNAFYRARGFTVDRVFRTPEGRLMHEYRREQSLP